MILPLVTIVALALAALFLILLIIKPVEKFTVLYDNKLKKLIDDKNKEERERHKIMDFSNREYRQKKTIDEIEKDIKKYDTVFRFIKENLNNIPVCREIDLRPDVAPTCSERDVSICSLNPYCKVAGTSCINKELNPECSNIMEKVDNKYTGKVTQMFLYPSVLEELK